MIETKDPFPKWSEPATKGDVLTAMIWTQSLVGSLLRVVVATRGDDKENLKAAFEKHNDEVLEFRRRIELLAGNDVS